MPADAHHLYVPPEPPPELPHLTEHSRPSGGEVHPMTECTRPSDSEVHPLIETSTSRIPPPPNDPTPLLDLGRGRGTGDRGQQVAGVGGEVG